jgi:hypothetical protein
MLSVIMLNVTYKSYMLSVFRLSVVAPLESYFNIRYDNWLKHNKLESVYLLS